MGTGAAVMSPIPEQCGAQGSGLMAVMEGEEAVPIRCQLPSGHKIAHRSHHESDGIKTVIEWSNAAIQAEAPA